MMHPIRSLLAAALAAFLVALPGSAQGVADTTGSPPPGHVHEESPPRLLNRDEILRMVARNHPPLLRDAGIGGVVYVEFVIEANGSVNADSIRVVEATDDAFVNPAVRVVRRMRFAPATVDGVPVRVRTTQPVTWGRAR